MSRNVQDNPSGWSRSLPGHTVEYEPGFAVSFSRSNEFSLGAGLTQTSTFNFADTLHVYFVDMIAVASWAGSTFTVKVYVNGELYVSATGSGFVNIPLRQNPSIFFVDGDSLRIDVTSHYSTDDYFFVDINGTRLVRPENYGHVPGASFSRNKDELRIGDTVTYTDLSTYNPTKWEWYFDTGNVDSTNQNPTYQYNIAGIFYTKLIAKNQYGSDVIVSPTALGVYDCIPYYDFAIYDPGSKLSVYSYYATAAGLTNADDARLYYNYGSGYFNDIDIRFNFELFDGHRDYNEVVLLSLQNNNGNPYSASGYHYVVLGRYLSGVYNVNVRLHNSTTSVDSPHITGLSPNTRYNARFYRPAGQNYGTVSVYAGSYDEDPIGSSSTPSSTGGDSSFSYLFPIASYNYGSSNLTIGCINRALQIMSH